VDWELEHWPEVIGKYLKDSGYDAAEKTNAKHVAAGRFQEDTIAGLRTFFPDWEIVNTPRSSHQPEFGVGGDPHASPESFLFRSTGTFSTAEPAARFANEFQGPWPGFSPCEPEPLGDSP
jgi:hypothetical protein